MIERGHAAAEVLALDLLAFESLHGSCKRLDAKRKEEAAWTSMIAAQARGEDMKKWTEQWKPLLDEDKETTGGLEQFLRDHPNGL